VVIIPFKVRGGEIEPRTKLEAQAARIKGWSRGRMEAEGTAEWY
jgi:hypothetical protein